MNTVPSQHGVATATKWHAFHRTVHKISMVFGVVSASMIVLAVLITCQMIFVRKVLGLSTIWQTEMVVYLVIAATVMGIPYVQMTRGHVNMDFVPMLLPDKGRRILRSFTTLLTIIIAVLMVFYGMEHFLYAYGRNLTSDTVCGVRLWIPYSVIPIGFTAMVLQLLSDLILYAQGKDAIDDATENINNTHTTQTKERD